MSKWFMVCEVEKIDLVKELRQLPIFSLPMQENVTVDDEIYVYLKAPFDALMYQLRVTAISCLQSKGNTTTTVTLTNNRSIARLKCLKCFRQIYLPWIF